MVTQAADSAARHWNTAGAGSRAQKTTEQAAFWKDYIHGGRWQRMNN